MFRIKPLPGMRNFSRIIAKISQADRHERRNKAHYSVLLIFRIILEFQSKQIVVGGRVRQWQSSFMSTQVGFSTLRCGQDMFSNLLPSKALRDDITRHIARRFHALYV